MHWKLVCCGPRDETFRAFWNSLNDGDVSIVVLLVDAEGPVDAEPLAHLQERETWNLTGVNDDSVHLMVQAMETWIVADADALAGYYGQHFNAAALPQASNLEHVVRRDVNGALRQATARTQKGRYQKIKHASDLLQRIDPATVQARCRHCRRLFDELGRMIHAA